MGIFLSYDEMNAEQRLTFDLGYAVANEPAKQEKAELVERVERAERALELIAVMTRKSAPIASEIAREVLGAHQQENRRAS